MDSSQYSGFSSHVQNQIFRMSQDQRGRSPGRSRISRGQHHNSQQYDQPLPDSINPISGINQPSSHAWIPQTTAPRPEMDSFPPLGSPRTSTSNQGSTHPNPHQPNQASARDFFDRARGGSYRGRGRRRANYSAHYGTVHNENSAYPMNVDYRHAPSNQNNRNFGPAMNHHFGTADQQRAFRQRVMVQSDYLNYVAQQSLKNLLSKEEQAEKHLFRKELEMIARTSLNQIMSSTEPSEQTAIRLECYGSLANSFGVAGCDMDLLLIKCSKDGTYATISEEAKRLLEKAILDSGYGARLLTNTRVPILRVCQKPGPELLENLRDYRQKWEQSLVEDKKQHPVDKSFPLPPNLTAEQELAAAAALLELDDTASEVALPPSPTLEQAKLEYVGECGIQCDVNFTNHVALHNTRLLWTYGQCDLRVRQMGIFVKNWAKARDINTPYRGTLSSYGYVLMVLHYVMNIANPPLVPNLQQRAKDEDFWYKKPVQLFEGFDVRFTQDIQQVQQIMSELPKNHESLGALLRGFFCYYATTQGFNWTQDIISIRTPGGIVSKRVKGWTEAKWSAQKQNVRLRYLCAIEDPFEIEHNVARTVGHSGIVAIRDEFRRAWRIIEGIYQDPQSRCWKWSNRENTSGGSGDELIERVENRGDLLKKDHEERKQKLRQMKQDLEAREESLRKQVVENDDTSQKSLSRETSNGTCKGVGFQMTTPPPIIAESTLRLINDHQHQHSKMRTTQDQKFWKTRQTDEEDYILDFTDTMSVTSVSTDGHFESSNGKDLECGDSSHQFRRGPHSLSKGRENLTHHRSSYLSIIDDSNARILGYCSAAKAASSPCGRTIEWNRQSKGGRWLLWRDKLIRNGCWINPKQGVEAALNARFPYDPTMTQEQLDGKNATLGRFYLHSLHPRLSKEDDSGFEKHQSIVDGCSSKNQHAVTCIREESALRTQSLNLEFLHELADNKTSKSTKPTAADDESTETAVDIPSTPKVAHQPSHADAECDQISEGNSKPSSGSEGESLSFLRERRLAFFTKKVDIDERSALDKSQDIETKGLSSETVFDQVSKRSRKDSAVEGSWNASYAQPNIWPTHKSNHAIKAKLPLVSRNESESDNAEDQSSLENNRAPVSTFSILLAQVGKLSTRHRLMEDPSILPIPVQPSFQIDPRQLVDMKIIEAGGNPCAMQGYEFAWESSQRSWAGGGSVVGRVASLQDVRSHTTMEELIASNGNDDMRLIAELPGYLE